MAVMKKKGNKELPPDLDGIASGRDLHDPVLLHGFDHDARSGVVGSLQASTATEVQKLEKKSLVSFIHIGQPTPAMQKKFGTAPRIQLNDSYRTEKDILDFIAAERDKLSESDRALMTVCLKADDQGENGYHHRREAGTSPGKRLEALFTPLRSRWDIKFPILYENDPMQLHRIVFYMPRSHPHHRSGRTRAVPTGAARTPSRIAPRHGAGRMPAERRARPHPNSDRAHRPAFRRWNPSLLPRPQPSRSAPLAEAATQHKRAETTASAFPRRSSVCPIPQKYDKIG